MIQKLKILQKEMLKLRSFLLVKLVDLKKKKDRKVKKQSLIKNLWV